MPGEAEIPTLLAVDLVRLKSRRRIARREILIKPIGFPHLP